MSLASDTSSIKHRNFRKIPTKQNMAKTYRTGVIGALLDEYERAIAELQKVIDTIPDNELATIVDPHTQDDNCRSIQTILTHVVHAGHGYATSIHNLKGHNRVRPAETSRVTAKEYINDLTNVFLFTENVFSEIKDEDVEQHNNNLKMMTGWGQIYDIEQLMEHAIVHILRHRRQIEKFREKIKAAK